MFWRLKFLVWLKPGLVLCMVGCALMRGPVVYGEESRSYTVVDAISAAIDHSNNLEAARTALALSKLDHKKAGMEMMPKVSFKHTEAIGSGGSRGTPQKGGSVKQSSNIEVKCNLFQGFGGTSKIQEKWEGVNVTQANLGSALDDAVSSAIKAYQDVLLSRKVRAMHEEQVHLLDEIKNRAVLKYKKGVASGKDVAATQAELASAKAQLTTKIADVENAEHHFLYVTGTAAPASMGRVEARDFPILQNLGEAVKKVQSDNKRVLVSRHTLQKSRHKLMAARSVMYPSLDLASSIDTGRRSAGSSSNGRTTKLSLSVPIFQGGTEYVTTSEAKLAVYKAECDLADMVQKVKVELNQVWNAHSTAKEGIEAYKSLVASREKHLTATQTAMDAGDSDTTELLNAQIALFKDRVELLSRENKLIDTCIRINILTGRFSSLDLVARGMERAVVRRM